MYLIRLTILFLFFAQLAQAQVPPQVCARLLLGLGQDSITWQATPCASFGGYVVLGDENNTGAFIPLDTVFTSNIANDNPNEVPWNYQVGMLCNGLLINLSFAVSNQRPITPNLTDVSIIGNVPVVSWDPSASPEVIGYQLYKEIPYGSGNYFPYPSSNFIINGLSYSDITATDLLARYAIVAVSPCNKSLLGAGNAIDGTTGPHTSMISSGHVDTCNQTISFSWNSYENWLEGVQQYEIWLNKNGSGFLPYDTVSNSATAYTYSNAQDNDLLIFQIRAKELNKNNFALSNNLSFDVRVNRPMDFLNINCLSVTVDNEIKIQWEWDTDVDFVSGDLLSGTDSNDLNSRLFLSVIGSSLNGFQDETASPQQSSYFYQIQTTDACGHVVQSNLAETIFLEVEALENFENKITWTAANFGSANVVEYRIYKIVNGGPHRIATVPAGEFTYLDQLDVTNETEAENCYFVVASLRLDFPNQSLPQFCESQSNRACAKQASNIHIPNAVSPGGKNRHFRPIIVFSQSIYSYSMVIFDRYGQQIFESNALYDAWDGTRNGEPLKMGMYVYVIRFQQPNGEWMERRGTVMLVR